MNKKMIYKQKKKWIIIRIGNLKKEKNKWQINTEKAARPPVRKMTVKATVTFTRLTKTENVAKRPCCRMMVEALPPPTTGSIVGATPLGSSLTMSKVTSAHTC